MLFSRREILKLTLAGATTLIWGCSDQTSSGFVKIFHLPVTFSRRYGDFTANIVGVLEPDIRASFQINGSEWREYP